MKLILLLLGAAAATDPCASAGGPDAVPCVHVARCGTQSPTSLAPFVLVESEPGAPRPPKQSAAATLCFDDAGLRFELDAVDTNVWTNASACGVDVFSLGSVLEVFAAPVATIYDAPVFYQETDVAPSGAAWVRRPASDDGAAAMTRLRHRSRRGPDERATISVDAGGDD